MRGLCDKRQRDFPIVFLANRNISAELFRLNAVEAPGSNAPTSIDWLQSKTPANRLIHLHTDLRAPCHVRSTSPELACRKPLCLTDNQILLTRLYQGAIRILDRITQLFNCPIQGGEYFCCHSIAQQNSTQQQMSSCNKETHRRLHQHPSYCFVSTSSTTGEKQ